MKRDLICIICPRGCGLTADVDGKKITVSGNGCPKGVQYAIDECTNPTRTVTAVVRVDNREDTMVSVKTENPIPKDKIFEVMDVINKTSVSAPMSIGDVVVDDIFGTRIVATKNIK